MLRRRAWLTVRVWSAIFGVAIITLDPAALKAQQPASSAVYVAGNAAVTGFSGALPPVQIAPGDDPDQKTFIDMNGPSLRVIDLQHMGGPAQAQLVAAPKPFTFTAVQLGQVFGVALDDGMPANIFAAASSAYGLPIVAPGPDGQPLHIKAGAPNARFMPGLWGPNGGPGSIWKIDGATGQVSLFATVTTNGRTNSGAALGGLAYDPDSKSLYVADRESGLIHRFDMNGRDLGSYDHGVTGRTAQGLPPVPWTTQQPINVASPQFDSTQPATWNYAAPQRRVFGLALHERRLYYAVADNLQIWSVGLNADGSFGKDAVIELAVPPSTGPTEISKITFDEQNRMFVADRAAPTGAFDFEALAVPAIGRVLRYALIELMPNRRRIWQKQPDEYAIGFPPDYRNGNGGVAIGYNYYASGALMPGSCGGFMWTTGEDLRHTTDAALAAQLGQSGPLDINGLQGNGTWRIRRGNEPPLESYFIDYDDEYDDPAERGHMGDVAIERLCSAAQRADLLPYGGAPPIGAPPTGVPPGVAPPRAGNPPGTPPGTPPSTPPSPPGGPPNIPGPPPNTPPGGCQPGQVTRAGTNECTSCSAPNIQVNGQCCSVTQLAANAACSNSSCPAGQTPIGPSNFCCNSSQVYSGPGGAQACCGGPLVNGKCSTPTPNPPSGCAKGYAPIGTACCQANQVTSTGVCCPAGQTPGGPNKSQCVVLIPIHFPQCCESGAIPTASGKCCPPAKVTAGGECCPGPVDPANRKACKVIIPLASCAAGYTKMPDGSCCNNRFVGTDGKSCNVGQQPCAPGEFRDERGVCVPIPTTSCPPGHFRDGSGACLPLPTTSCPPGQERNRQGACVPMPSACPPGQERNREGNCVPVSAPACPRGEERNREGNCVPIAPAGCPPGEERNREGACVPVEKPCPPGEIRNRDGACVPAGPPPRLVLPPPRGLLPPPPPRPPVRGPIEGPGLFRH